MRSKKICGRLFLCAVFILVAACSNLPAEFPAFDFTVEDVFTGEEIHLEDLRGRPVLIYFFASW